MEDVNNVFWQYQEHGKIFLSKWRISFTGSCQWQNRCPISLRSEYSVFLILEGASYSE
jgi:hypothetical protein